MALTKQQLLDLKTEIEQAEEKVSDLKGQKKALMNQLKEDWGCDSLKDAREKLDKIKTGVDELEEKINNGISELEEKYDID